jgi:hypothetical protein
MKIKKGQTFAGLFTSSFYQDFGTASWFWFFFCYTMDTQRWTQREREREREESREKEKEKEMCGSGNKSPAYLENTPEPLVARCHRS